MHRLIEQVIAFDKQQEIQSVTWGDAETGAGTDQPVTGRRSFISARVIQNLDPSQPNIGLPAGIIQTQFHVITQRRLPGQSPPPVNVPRTKSPNTSVYS